MNQQHFPLVVGLLSVTIGLASASRSVYAQPSPKPLSLSFEEIKKLASLTVNEKELPFREPAVLLRKQPDGRNAVYVFPGDIVAQGALPLADLFAFQTQLRLELMRTHLFAAPNDRTFIAAACDQAEKHIQNLVALKLASLNQPADRKDITTINVAIQKEKRNLWNDLYRSFDAWASQQGNTFRGFLLVSPDNAWTPDGAHLIPFDTSRAYSPEPPLMLVGQAGVKVHIIANLKKRIYELKKTPETDWEWEQTYTLNPGKPTAVHLIVGANYYFWACRGTSQHGFSKRVESSDREITVPLPE